MEHQLPHFLLCIDFYVVFSFYHSSHQNPKDLQRYDITKRSIAQSNVETVIYLKLVVWAVWQISNIYHVSLKNLKYPTWAALVA